MALYDTITAVPGLTVGHYTDLAGGTGCTVVLCPAGAVAAVDVRGAAPGTRETDALRSGGLVGVAHGILLTGGSAYGLEAAAGVMRYLEERGHGYVAGGNVVPIVPAAVIFDLNLGDPKARPGPEEGYQACLAASNGGLAQGSVGAGTGATVGKILGVEQSTKGGIGSASASLGRGAVVGALVVVNAYGDVVAATPGPVLAGTRDPATGRFLDSAANLHRARRKASPGTNTTIGVVATNVSLTRAQLARLAVAAHDGLALAVRPAHTMFDGDTFFTLSLSLPKAARPRPAAPVDLNRVAWAATTVVAASIRRAVESATGLHGIPSCRDVPV